MQYYVSNHVGPELTDIASSLTCIGVMVLVLKFWKPKSIMRLEGDRPATLAASPHSAGDIFTAWIPYIFLVVFVLIWGEADIKLAINRWTDTLLPAWVAQSPTLLNGLLVPGLHNAITRIPPVVAQPTPYAAVFEWNWLSASGSACLLAAIATSIVLGVSPRRFAGVYKATFKQLALPMLTIASMLGLAYLMNYSGMTSTLGLALAATGWAFPFFSAVLGWLGVFLTGSDTSANALFGNLQVVTATALHLNPVLTASVNSAAGVMGKMISVQSIAVAVAATGMDRSEESRLFRFTIKHSVFLMVVMGIFAMLYAYVFPGSVPVAPLK
jgi:lactate permease